MGLDIWDLIWAPTWLLIWPLIYSLMFYQPCFWALSKTPPIASELCSKIIISIKEGECVQWTRDWFKAQLLPPAAVWAPVPSRLSPNFPENASTFFLAELCKTVCSVNFSLAASRLRLDFSKLEMRCLSSDSIKILQFRIGFIAKNVFIYIPVSQPPSFNSY